MSDQINKISSIGSVGNSTGAKKAVNGDNTSFKNILENSINEVNKYQKEASEAVTDLSSGKTDDLSKVMIAVKKSDVAFTALMETRNKLVDAYNEIMRMRFQFSNRKLLFDNYPYLQNIYKKIEIILEDYSEFEV